jgi:nucleoid DNA-binding protein
MRNRIYPATGRRATATTPPPVPRILTKRDIANLIAEPLGLTRRQAARALDAITCCIANHLADGGERVAIRGLGTIQVRTRKAFSTRNPISGERMTINSRKGLTFKPSGELVSRLN